MRTRAIGDEQDLNGASWRLARVDVTGWLAHPGIGAGRSVTSSVDVSGDPCSSAGGSAVPVRRRRPRRTEAARAMRERDLARRRRRRHARSFVVDRPLEVGGPAGQSRPASARRVVDPADRLGGSGAAGGCRIGRWGRLAITALVAATLALMIGRLLAGVGAGSTIEIVDVTVRPGDTLWSIASAAAPDSDPRVVIDGIRGLNDLPGDVVRVGEVLRVPAASG